MSPMMQAGVELALYGMGTVFVFLTLLVLATMLMSRVILANTDFPVEPVPSTVDDTASSKRRIAVISAAIARYRAEHER